MQSKFVKILQRGEIATILTLLTVGLIALGAAAGTVLVRSGTRLTPLAQTGQYVFCENNLCAVSNNCHEWKNGWGAQDGLRCDGKWSPNGPCACLGGTPGCVKDPDQADRSQDCCHVNQSATFPNYCEINGKAGFYYTTGEFQGLVTPTPTPTPAPTSTPAPTLPGGATATPPGGTGGACQAGSGTGCDLGAKADSPAAGSDACIQCLWYTNSGPHCAGLHDVVYKSHPNCSINQVVNYWCNGGVGQAGADDCTNTKTGTCNDACKAGGTYSSPTPNGGPGPGTITPTPTASPGDDTPKPGGYVVINSKIHSSAEITDINNKIIWVKAIRTSSASTAPLDISPRMKQVMFSAPPTVVAGGIYEYTLDQPLVFQINLDVAPSLQLFADVELPSSPDTSRITNILSGIPICFPQDLQVNPSPTPIQDAQPILDICKGKGKVYTTPIDYKNPNTPTPNLTPSPSATPIPTPTPDDNAQNNQINLQFKVNLDKIVGVPPPSSKYDLKSPPDIAPNIELLTRNDTPLSTKFYYQNNNGPNNQDAFKTYVSEYKMKNRNSYENRTYELKHYQDIIDINNNNNVVANCSVFTLTTTIRKGWSITGEGRDLAHAYIGSIYYTVNVTDIAGGGKSITCSVTKNDLWDGVRVITGSSNEDFFQVIDMYTKEQIGAKEVSLFIAQLTRTPSLQMTFCEPQNNGCSGP